MFFLGFPSSCFNYVTQKPKFSSISIHLNNRQFCETIFNLFPVLENKNYKIFKQDSQRKLKEFNISNPKELHDSGYTGVLIIKEICQPAISDNLLSQPVISDNLLSQPVISDSHLPNQLQPSFSCSSSEDNNENAFDAVRNIFGTSRLLVNNDVTHKIYVSRETLVRDILDQFKHINDSDNLYVRYDHEIGEDHKGITRDMFSEFWLHFIEDYTIGDNQRFLSLSPDLLSEDDLVTVGKILLLGQIHTKFIPLQLNHSTLFYIFTGNMPSSTMVRRSFLSCLSESDKSLVEKALNCQIFTNDFKLDIVNFLSKFNWHGIPTPHDFSIAIEKLAKFVAFVQPHYILHYVRKGVKSFVNPIEGQSENVFNQYVASIKPSGSEVADKLNPSFSESIPLRSAEERCFQFLEEYVRGLKEEDAAMFVKYVSGIEVLPGSIEVEFNSESREELMIPRVNTCSVSLVISRFFTTKKQLTKIMTHVLKNPSLWKRFDVF